MGIKVKTPDGKTINFPDSMTPDQVQGAMRKLYPPAAPAKRSWNDPLIPAEDWFNKNVSPEGEAPPVTVPLAGMTNITLPGEAATGLAQGGARTVQEMSRPTNLASGLGLGALMRAPGVFGFLNKAIFSGLFGAEGVKQAYKAATEEKTTRGKTAGATSGILQGIMAAMPWIGEFKAARPVAEPKAATPAVTPTAVDPMTSEPGPTLPVPKPVPPAVPPKLLTDVRREGMLEAFKEGTGLPDETLSEGVNAGLFEPEAFRTIQIPGWAQKQLPAASLDQYGLPPTTPLEEIFGLRKQTAPRVIEGTKPQTFQEEFAREGASDLDLAVADRLAEIHDMFSQGIGHLSGKSRNLDTSQFNAGAMANLTQRDTGFGRLNIKGGFPELRYIKENPLRIAQAIEKAGNNRLYRRVVDAVREEMRDREVNRLMEENRALREQLGGDEFFDYEKAGVREPGEEGFARMKDKPPEGPMFDFMAGLAESQGENRVQMLNDVIRNVLAAPEGAVSKRDLLGLTKKKPGKAATPLFDENIMKLFKEK